MNIILYEPEIPYNTGNIGRTCVLTNTNLHLIKPLGFSIDEKAIKRAGLDYWKYVKLFVWESFDEFLEKNPNARIYYATTKTNKIYTDVKYEMNDYIMFGPESRGIPEDILYHNKENCIKIPMVKMGRSLNLSNSVVVVLYEALRQNNFEM
ncbi:tRNA (uridine(34)/cytosine(34)/5-carboxymethylaminomethyluridine(34)-2'-O)-methyltransferase TrmL [Oceanivirga miroungae]|uniref:Putative tRNA (cytidine(34)-2'-O)-methyltransferase n=1 Tax=Oceanivirga miroungae TaxID=1130046 RepID=A0A6I8M6E1_9FUSO|nr:tRNA (uridine(34)/cytosine(34)/5-carboxymethylaminomethyluridine(34)-2'-O)-methyltransferase TrmL [Oceanivirga miroungae]VWL85460.1 tRNA/rRNA methyltransferase SpoU [Oceanivirga miroungae]